MLFHKNSFSKNLFCNIPITRLNPLILVKDDHKYSSPFSSDLVASFFTSYPGIANLSNAVSQPHYVVNVVNYPSVTDYTYVIT